MAKGFPRERAAAMRRAPAWMSIIAIGVAMLIAPAMALAHGSIPGDVPVNRLVANLTKYIQAHPNDAEGYYRLGRVHTLALETKTEFVLAFEREDPIEPAEGSWAKRPWSRGGKPQNATPEQLRTHLTEAIRNLNAAIERRPTEGRYHLTLACALEAGETLMKDVDAWPLCPVKGALDPRPELDKFLIDDLRGRFESAAKQHGNADDFAELFRTNNWHGLARDVVITLAYEHRQSAEYKELAKKLRAFDWHEQIEEQFFTAMCYALPSEGKATEKPIWGGMDNWVSYEAGQDFIRVVAGRKSRPTDKIRIKVANQTVKAFDELTRPDAITPIVVDFLGRRLREIESSAITAFDLDGTRRPQRQTWIQSDVGILAWDPDHSGHITSGRQLFGSISWWLFFDNGYDALDLLDDDRDGELTGAELDGIVVWFDRNSDGVSDPGEVTPVQQLGIVAISCRATGRDGASPVNPTGLRLSDGGTAPTFDWVVRRNDPR
jgi:hypothetical protein